MSIVCYNNDYGIKHYFEMYAKADFEDDETRRMIFEYFIDKMPDSSIAILMLHSILRKGDKGYGYDRYYWDADTFESFCVWLKAQRDIRICMTKELF